MYSVSGIYRLFGVIDIFLANSLSNEPKAVSTVIIKGPIRSSRLPSITPDSWYLKRFYSKGAVLLAKQTRWSYSADYCLNVLSTYSTHGRNGTGFAYTTFPDASRVSTSASVSLVGSGAYLDDDKCTMYLRLGSS